MIKTNKGFSLVELVIALGIIIIMTGAAALYLGDIYFRAQVTKSLEDMETIGKALLLHDTENGQNLFETELVGYTVGVDPAHLEKDTLNNLVGVYIAVLPKDPWGSNYLVNSYAGWISSYAADYKIGGTSKYERDIKYYYLPENLFVTKVRVDDNDSDGIVSEDDSLTVYFSKSVRLYAANAVQATLVAAGGVGEDAIDNFVDDLSTKDADNPLPAPTAAGPTTGRFNEYDLSIILPGAVTPTVASTAAAGWSRPIDTPYSYPRYSRELVVEKMAGTDATDIASILTIGSQVVIPTGTVGAVAPWDDPSFGNTRGSKYIIWESTLGYVNGYKTPGQHAKLFLQNQAPETAARTVLFKTLVD